MDNNIEAIDRISELPPFIIHHIMSYLSTKEVVQTSVLSKAWYHIWASFPILDFDQTYFVGNTLASYCPKHFSQTQRQQFCESIGNFIKFVDDSLLRFHQLNFSMQKFRLFVSLLDVELCSTIDKWIKLALESGVKKFDLCIKTSENMSYTLPETVFSAQWINALRIHGCSLVQPFARCDILCRSLEKLTLESVHVNQEMMQKLTSECPLLEDLIVRNCWGLKCFDVSKHFKLKTIRLCSNELDSIKIVAPSLQYFYLCCRISSPCMINMVVCQNLKTLSLSSVNLTGQEFHNLDSTFPLLENLLLRHCDHLQKVKISSERLKELGLIRNAKLETVEIDTPNLLRFFYWGYKVPPTYSINAPCPWFVNFAYYGFLDTLWYNQIREFLGTTIHIADLSLILMVQENISNVDKSREISTYLPREVGHLHLVVVSFVSNYSALLDGLLWICYPKTLSMQIHPRDENHFFRWFYMELKKKDVNCCGSNHSRCWRHYLKDIKIEKFEEEEDAKDNETFCLDTLMDAELTPAAGTIYFSLEWCFPLSVENA